LGQVAQKESNGDVKLTSDQEGKPALKTEMLISNKDKSSIWWSGYDGRFATGVSAARDGRPFIADYKSPASEFGAGFDYGYPQGYQMYKATHAR